MVFRLGVGLHAGLRQSLRSWMSCLYNGSFTVAGFLNIVGTEKCAGHHYPLSENSRLIETDS